MAGEAAVPGQQPPGSNDVEKKEESLRVLIETFKRIAGDDGRIDIDELKKALGIKESFFVDRYFRYFDQDGSGDLELEEFITSNYKILNMTIDEKLKFLFDVFDLNGDGTISSEELTHFMRACVKESGMTLEDTQLDELVTVFMASADTDGSGSISFEELREQFSKYPAVIDNIDICPSNWLRPPAKKKKSGLLATIKQKTSKEHINNHLPPIVFISVYIFVTIALFVLNCVLYSDRNIYIILARGAGMCLNFNSALIVVFMLRRSLTWMRSTVVGPYLPIDDNIELHKMTGYAIAFHTFVHTIMHLGNIAEIQGTIIPADVINATYNNVSGDDTDGALKYWEILFTTRAGIGWVEDSAFVTGFALDVILLIMIIGANSRIRASGYFQVFYWSHLLYWVFWILVIIHAPNFKYWLLIPGLMFIIEKISYLISSCRKSQSFFIERVHLLQSRVTHLVISRPPKFNYHAGDYVFIRIPDIAPFEWHPFTISSAPEQKDVFSLHIRSLGNWTGKLHDFYKSCAYMKAKKYPVAVEPDQEAGIHNLAAKNIELSLQTSALTAKRRSSAIVINYINDRRKVYIDGPYGTPTQGLTSTNHAVLVAAGIGVTPCASILQSLLNQMRANKEKPLGADDKNYKLKKVDFIWVNREMADFRWFLVLLTQLEMEDAQENAFSRFLSIHLYLTSAKNKADLKGVGLQMALEMLHEQSGHDVLTGLKTRMQPGRPDWKQLLGKLKDENHGKVHIFFCGSPAMAGTVKAACDTHGFLFSDSF